jgi:hypothetical protein
MDYYRPVLPSSSGRRAATGMHIQVPVLVLPVLVLVPVRN